MVEEGDRVWVMAIGWGRPGVVLSKRDAGYIVDVGGERNFYLEQDLALPPTYDLEIQGD